MPDLISREKLIEDLSYCASELFLDKDYVAVKIAKQRAVDAVPVVHGQWVGDETMTAYDVQGVKTWAVKRKCTKCGFVRLFIEAHMYYDFCPKCGAKMDGNCLLYDDGERKESEP